MSEATELLPCPLCDGPAEIWRATPQGRTAWVSCMGKCAVLVSKEYTTTEEAVERWNTRPALAAARAEERERAARIADSYHEAACKWASMYVREFDGLTDSARIAAAIRTTEQEGEG